MTKILITGGCGFVGHHVIEHFLKATTWQIITFDKLTYAARGLDRVRDIQAFDAGRVAFYSVDFSVPISEGILRECKDVDYILHLGAETHVDNSIVDPMPFIHSNVLGTAHMLEFAKLCHRLKAFVYFSTDEVYGPAPEGVAYKEWDRYNCTNPYSATKAAIWVYGEGLRARVNREGVGVSVIIPGFVKTPMTEANPYFMPFRISAERAAALIKRGLAYNKPRIRFPRPIPGVVYFLSLLPPTWIDRFVTLK